jgi:hypothetical protein
MQPLLWAPFEPVHELNDPASVELDLSAGLTERKGCHALPKCASPALGEMAHFSDDKEMHAVANWSSRPDRYSARGGTMRATTNEQRFGESLSAGPLPSYTAMVCAAPRTLQGGHSLPFRIACVP